LLLKLRLLLLLIVAAALAVSQGWLGRSDHVVHQGEGIIRTVAWHGSTLVWANDIGVKVLRSTAAVLHPSCDSVASSQWHVCCVPTAYTYIQQLKTL
jgi:hypothetical protein